MIMDWPMAIVVSIALICAIAVLMNYVRARNSSEVNELDKKLAIAELELKNKTAEYEAAKKSSSDNYSCYAGMRDKYIKSVDEREARLAKLLETFGEPDKLHGLKEIAGIIRGSPPPTEGEK